MNYTSVSHNEVILGNTQINIFKIFEYIKIWIAPQAYDIMDIISGNSPKSNF